MERISGLKDQHEKQGDGGGGVRSDKNLQKEVCRDKQLSVSEASEKSEMGSGDS